MCPGRVRQIRVAILAVIVACLAHVGPAVAGTVRLAWDPNTEPTLAGYALVYGPSSGVYTSTVTLPSSAQTHELSLPDGTYFFAIRAYDTAGAYSGYSNEVRVDLVGTPGPPSQPRITTLSPAVGPAAGGTTVTIDGSDFRSGATVRFGTQAATVQSLTSTRIVARTPAHVPGVVALSVVNSDGQGVQLAQAFTYQAAAPVITSIAPSQGPVAGNTDITITGTNFQSGVSVSMDGLTAPVVSASATHVVVRTPARRAGVVGLMLTNPDSQSATRASAYTYVEGGPAITHVLPPRGPMTGGNTITIVGSGLASATVSFGGTAATVVSRTAGMMEVVVPAHAAGEVDVVVSADGLSSTAARAYTFEDPDAPFARYFAEGATGGFFETRFALANPHAENLPVTVTFTDTMGTATPMQVTVPAMSRVTIDGSNMPTLASDAFATVFASPKVLGVERTMQWAGGGMAYGSHSDTGVAAPRTLWFLAEGATTSNFNTFYLLQNPTTTQADVRVQYLLATGERIEKMYPLAPLSRANIWVNKDDPRLASAEMSATITSLNDVPIVVERSMYRNNGSELFSAGHNSAAVDAPALRWFLAEGATGGTFDEFVLVANPNAEPATLRVSYLRGGETPLVKTYVAAPHSRLTIWVDKEAPELAAAEVSIVIESTTPTPVVVERAMWWRAAPDGPWIEAHNSSGVTATASRWLVADGESGGPGKAVTYVLVANTGDAPATVSVTLLSESGAVRTVQDVVSANSRYTIDVAGTFPEARDTRFSVLVEGANGAEPLVVERASYTSTPSTPWAAGTNSLAVPLP